MRKLATILISATLISGQAMAKDDRVVGTYSGGKVTEKEVQEQFQPFFDAQGDEKKLFSKLDKKTQEMLVRGYINQKLVEKEAKKLGISESKEFKDKIKAVESQMLGQELIERHLNKAITDKMINDEYNKMAEKLKGQKEVKVSHILVDSEDQAKDIKKKLNKGAKFDTLVKEFSKDEGSKTNNGELGYVMKGQLVPEFESKAFSMKKGEISEPVKTTFGWHIIKVLDSRMVKVPTKEEASGRIKEKLSRETVEKYFKKLSDDAKVEVKIEE